MFNQNFVEKHSDKIAIEEILADLIPGFLKNKTLDLKILNQALVEKDYEKFKKIGHNWKGACSSYGFHYLGEVGKQFELLAADQDHEKLTKLMHSLPQYLKNIQLEYPTSSEPGSNELHS
ncbi:MAG: Hpt domain-containing protein [Bdellovibrio sp.]|nr:Hpt domain-containing protein [Bdellovibrio sp.]